MTNTKFSRAALSLLGAAALIGAATVSQAHHSFAAQYDSNKPTSLEGVVTKVEWTNPHARFFVDVKDTKGKVTNYEVELGSPNKLLRYGWNRKSMPVSYTHLTLPTNREV